MQPLKPVGTSTFNFSSNLKDRIPKNLPELPLWQGPPTYRAHQDQDRGKSHGHDIVCPTVKPCGNGFSSKGIS